MDKNREQNDFSEMYEMLQNILDRYFTSQNQLSSVDDKRKMLLGNRNNFFEDCDGLSMDAGMAQKFQTVYKEMMLNPDTPVDLAKIFGLKTKDISHNSDNIIISKVNGKRLGTCTGTRHSRDSCICILHLPSSDAVVSISKNGCLCLWTKEFKLQLCTDVCRAVLVKDMSWVTDCVYLPRLKRLLVSTEKALCFVDPKFSDNKQLSYIMRPALKQLRSVAYVSPDEHSTHLPQAGDSILIGDAEGSVSLITVHPSDMSNVDAPRGRQKEPGIVELHVGRLINAPARTRKLHSGEIIKLRYFHKIRKFVSCCESSTDSLIIDKIEIITTKCDYTSVNVPGGVQSFELVEEELLLVAGGKDRQLRFWSTGDLLAPLACMPGHLFAITQVSLSALHRLAFSLSADDRIVRIWNLDSYKCLQVFRPTEDIYGDKRMYCMNFIESYGCLVTGSSLIDVWTLRKLVLNKSQEESKKSDIPLMTYGKKYEQLICVSSHPSFIYVNDSDSQTLRHAIPTKTNQQPISLCLNEPPAFFTRTKGLSGRSDLLSGRNSKSNGRCHTGANIKGDAVTGRSYMTSGRGDEVLGFDEEGEMVKGAGQNMQQRSSTDGLRLAVAFEDGQLVVCDIGVGCVVKKTDLAKIAKEQVYVHQMVYGSYCDVSCLIVSFNYDDIIFLSEVSSLDFQLLRHVNVSNLYSFDEFHLPPISSRNSVIQTDRVISPSNRPTSNEERDLSVELNENNCYKGKLEAMASSRKSSSLKNQSSLYDIKEENMSRLSSSNPANRSSRETSRNSKSDRKTQSSDCKIIELRGDVESEFAFLKNNRDLLILDINTFEITIFDLSQLKLSDEVIMTSVIVYKSNDDVAFTPRLETPASRLTDAKSCNGKFSRITNTYANVNEMEMMFPKETTTYLVIAVSNGALIILNYQEIKPIAAVLSDTTEGISCLAASHDHRLIFSGHSDGFLTSWSFHEDALNPIIRWSAHEDEINLLQVIKSMNILCSSSTDGCVKFWSVNGDGLMVLQFNGSNCQVKTVEENSNANNQNNKAAKQVFVASTTQKDAASDDEGEMEENFDEDAVDNPNTGLERKPVLPEKFFSTTRIIKNRPSYNNCQVFKREEADSVYLTLPLFALHEHHLHKVIPLMHVQHDY